MAFGYFFGGGPITSVPPPKPKVGDIWAYKEAGNPDVKLGQMTKITHVGEDGDINSLDVDEQHIRMWGSHEMFWAGWKLHTSVDLAAQILEKAKKVKERYPHKCPRCGNPAYVGGGPSNVDCHNFFCSTRSRTMALQRQWITIKVKA